MQQQQLITITEAADIADRHVATIRRWIASGALTAWQINRSEVRVDRDELADLIAPRPVVKVAS